MPRPVYIICSESGTIDDANNLVSIFHVIERVVVQKPSRAEEHNLVVSRFRIVSVWAKEEGDESTEFEAQFSLVRPNGSEFSKKGATFRFPEDKHLHRFVIRYQGASVFGDRAGIFRIIGKVRPKGSDVEWIVQDYPIFVDLEEEKSGESSSERPSGV